MISALIARIETERLRRPPVEHAASAATEARLVDCATEARPVACATAALLVAFAVATIPARAATPAVVPVAPAVAPAPLVVPPAATAASDAPARDASADIAGVTDAVRNWAAAWSRKDADAYIAAYVPGFKGGEPSAATWQASRRERIKGKGRISVEVSNIVVLIGRSQKSATFTQAYSADSLRQQNRKTLEFEQRDGRWLIVRETSGSSSRS